jgi:hypothetical protein
MNSDNSINQTTLPQTKNEIVVSNAVVLTPDEQLVFESKLSIERAMIDNDLVVPKTRKEYVSEFSKGLVKTARSTLEMCRVVYEAKESLDSFDFGKFCSEIGYRDSSSTIRKYIAIGKVYPRLVKLAEQLPASWTNIYIITQLPADTFEELENGQRSLASIKGKELANLLKSTQSIASIDEYLPKDKKLGGVVFAKLMFMQKPDETDWRAMRKALAELESRLPIIRFEVNEEADWIVGKRRLVRYEHAKHQYDAVEFKPELWDLGSRANETVPEGERHPKAA